MKVLLLGATGLLGHNVLRHLLQEGHEVVALVRRPDGIRLEGGGWQTVVGSLLSYPTVRDAAQGCDAVVNCAGTTDMSLRHYDDFLPVNRDLCAHMVRLLDEGVVHTVVHTSSVDTIGFGSAEHPADEDTPMREPFLSSLYARSKREGEQLLTDAARRLPHCHVVVVNPGFMIGPYDVGPSSGQLLLAAYRRPLMLAPKGGKAFVAADDVAVAIVNALARGTSGARYILTNSHGCLSIRQLYRLQARCCGYRQRVLSIPNGMLLAAGKIGDLLRTLGLRTQISSNNVRQLSVTEHYANHRAVQELGLPETPVETALHDFFSWFANKQ